MKRATKKITIYLKDGENSFEKMVEEIKSRGNIGHSFSIVIDPDNEPKTFGWDGDGGDSIEDIKIETVEDPKDLKESNFISKILKEANV